jgi:hypothetical protein
VPSISRLVLRLRSTGVRLRPPEAAVITHTFIKIRQEARNPDINEAYASNIAYREFVYQHGTWGAAFDTAGDEELVAWIAYLCARVRYVGKRGSFVQFRQLSRVAQLPAGFTEMVDSKEPWQLPNRGHVVPMDDFGPQASLETLSSYSSERVARGRHREFTWTIVPLGLEATGPGFTDYRVV